MRRTVLGRAFATFLAAWFVFASQGAVLFSSCPMQSMDMGASAASRAATVGMAGMQMAPDGSARPGTPPTHQQQHTDRPPCCTSPACCCNGVTGPANAPSMFALRTQAATRAGQPERSYQASWADHILPFAAAPPAAPSA